MTGFVDLTGKTVLVTGGSRGIGEGIVRGLLEQGASVVLNYTTSKERAETIADEYGRERCLPVQAHMDRVEDLERLWKEAVAWKGRIDVLVNNAGGQFPSPAKLISPKGFEAVVRNNLLGTFNVTSAVANQAMIPQRKGRIINVIANVVRGFPGMAHTGAARSGVDNLTKSLAVEWAPYGIQVNAVAPGTIRSTGTDRYPPELVVKAEQQTPAGRLGSPAEVSHLVTFLASDAADYVTGSTFYIDGGASLWGDIWEIDRD